MLDSNKISNPACATIAVSAWSQLTTDECAKAKELYLNNNPSLNDHSLNILTPHLHRFTGLTNIYLQANPLVSNASCPSLAAALRLMPTITTIWLNGTAIGDGTLELLRALGEHVATGEMCKVQVTKAWLGEEGGLVWQSCEEAWQEKGRPLKELELKGW